ncbi:hypothetical protein ACOMHN_021920 [Nucella lapillus]
MVGTVTSLHDGAIDSPADRTTETAPCPGQDLNTRRTSRDKAVQTSGNQTRRPGTTCTSLSQPFLNKHLWLKLKIVVPRRHQTHGK